MVDGKYEEDEFDNLEVDVEGDEEDSNQQSQDSDDEFEQFNRMAKAPAMQRPQRPLVQEAPRGRGRPRKYPAPSAPQNPNVNKPRRPEAMEEGSLKEDFFPEAQDGYVPRTQAPKSPESKSTVMRVEDKSSNATKPQAQRQEMQQPQLTVEQLAQAIILLETENERQKIRITNLEAALFRGSN